MRDPIRRPIAAAVILALVVISIGAAQPPATTGHAVPGFERFLYALGQVESGGRYTARNRSSGAYGKYQIIPSSWRAWARQVLGDANAPKTAANQERVARAKIHQAFHRFGSWPVVAYWWLTGRSTRNAQSWSPFARRYVNKIMRIYRSTVGGPPLNGPAPPSPVAPSIAPETVPAPPPESALPAPSAAPPESPPPAPVAPPETPPESAPPPAEVPPATPPETQPVPAAAVPAAAVPAAAVPAADPPQTTPQIAPQLVRYQETHSQVTWAGAWGTAAHRSYGGSKARWSRQAGATATFAFDGMSVAWIGPKGPTRGAARVYVDGALVRRIDLRAAAFRPVNTLFSASWPEVGTHTLVIQVVGTRGRPIVAIDEIRVVR